MHRFRYAEAHLSVRNYTRTTKANRTAAPEDLVKQIPHILQLRRLFRYLRFEHEGFEADDVIGTRREERVGNGRAFVV